jgi:hypothetical protein
MVDVVVVSTWKWTAEIEKELLEQYHFTGRIIVMNDARMSRPFEQYETLSNLIPEEKYKVYLEKNGIFKNKYRNQTCYILGNGPSLNKNNLDKIKHEIKFVVNDFYRHDRALDVMPDYYFAADPQYFDLDSQVNRDFFEGIFSMIKYNPEITYWFPVYHQEFIDSNFGMYRKYIYYYLPRRNLTCVEDNRIDFTEVIPTAHAVVQFAVLLAIYMGFTDIKLLGCEQTNIPAAIESFLSDTTIDYAFDMPDDAKEESRLLYIKNSSVKGTLFGSFKTFEEYSALYDICVKRGIKITNCVDRSLIQDIPKGDFIR